MSGAYAEFMNGRERGLDTLKIATWNINSVRLRLNLVRRFLAAHRPDVLCLQETKVIDELFPAKALQKAGYVHQAIRGQKGYHGVAILSRTPFASVRTEELCGKTDCRHISVVFESGIELHNFYVPAGADIPDPDANPKFAHKLDFLRQMARMFEYRRDGSTAPVVLVGDLNVAPLENDVWSHKQLLKVVSHTPVETTLLERVRASYDWIDVTRSFVAREEKIYSWWSYRARDWRASDRGRRLDHIWLSPALRGQAVDHAIFKAARGWKLASDHVPVLATIAV
ncbi:MAG TPA: exodeoxyribonuclease III [Rhizomicrobium sp.]|jgi:exodeoxyribonuclease-3|nr:exodeoxyribonuclease III [Rhizomicrobium sp.]